MNRYYSIILFMLFLLCITGCKMPEKVTGKPTDPIKIHIKFAESEYNKDENIKLNIAYDFLDQNSKSAKITIEADAPIKLDNTEFQISNIENIKSKSINVKLMKPFDTNGYGIIRANLYTYDEGGEQLYYKSTSIYFHISDDEVMLGIYGVTELREKHLKKLLDTGKITDKEYKVLMEELSREGITPNETTIRERE